MTRFISIATLFFQIFIAFVVLFAIYIVFAFLDINEFDFTNGLGFFIFQPIYGFLLCALTIIFCIIIGLPIRFSSRIFNWWSTKPLIVFSGVAIGFILLIISLNPHFRATANIIIDGEQKKKGIPNITFALTGWFLIAFSLLHFFPFPVLKWFRAKVFSARSISSSAKGIL